MNHRVVPYLLGVTLFAVSCSGGPGTTLAPGETEVVRFAVPTLDD